jgi:acyl-coenzyme A synthetase/AMP-(fatty) acid ligase
MGQSSARVLQNPEKTAHTDVTIGAVRDPIRGDLATLESEGQIRLLGPAPALASSPAARQFVLGDVEEALKANPAIADGLVFGAPDPRSGPSVAASVGLAPGAAAQEGDLIAHVRARLAVHKAPRRSVIADKAPADKVAACAQRQG